MKTPNLFNKLLVILLGFFLSVSLFLNYYYFQYYQNRLSQFSHFVQDFYVEVEKTIYVLNELIEDEPTGDRLHDRLLWLTVHLNKLDYMLRRVPYYLGEDVYGGSTDIAVTLGIINSGTTHKGHLIPPFREGNALSPNELAFLKAFKAYLENIHYHLQSEGNISRQQYNRILSEHVLRIQYDSFLDAYTATEHEN